MMLQTIHKQNCQHKRTKDKAKENDEHGNIGNRRREEEEGGKAREGMGGRKGKKKRRELEKAHITHHQQVRTS